MLFKDYLADVPKFPGEEYAEIYGGLLPTTREMQHDILASVPQHMGYGPKNRNSPPSDRLGPPASRHLWSGFRVERSWYRDRDPWLKDDVPVVRTSEAYSILWPLYLVGVIDIATPEIQAYVIDTLRAVGTQMGIGQGLMMARLLERQLALRGLSTPQPALPSPLNVLAQKVSPEGADSEA